MMAYRIMYTINCSSVHTRFNFLYALKSLVLNREKGLILSVLWEIQLTFGLSVALYILPVLDISPVIEDKS